MKFKYFALLQYILLLLPFATTQAAEAEAAQHLNYCKTTIGFTGSSTPTPIEAMNMGYCLGLMDGLRGVNYFLKKADPSSAFCEPENYDNRDLAKTFVEIAITKPELKELRGALAAQAALRAAFPCKK